MSRRPCPVCGGGIALSRGRKAIYCSLLCNVAASNARAKLRAEVDSLIAPAPPKRWCGWCGETLGVTKSKRAKFCGRYCANADGDERRREARAR